MQIIAHVRTFSTKRRSSACARALQVSAALSTLFSLSCGDNQTVLDPKKPYEAAAITQLACTPNLDGKIDASELTPVLDVATKLLVSPLGVERTTSVVPAVDGSGKNRWDYSIDYADDRAATLTASTVTGKWYAASFPGDAFVLPFDLGGAIEAVYRYDQTALSLLGLASKQPSPPEGKTLWTYSTPIALYKFPLSPGASYTVSSDVRNGTARGAPYAAKDTYEVKVDAAGQVDLPDLIFQQALRVRVKVTVSPVAGADIIQRQVSFLSECSGEIARITSRTAELVEDFTVAKEVRRIGF
jgi:hypothetical protein